MARNGGCCAAAAGPGCFRRLSIALTAVSVIGFALLNITLDEQSLFGLWDSEGLVYDTLTIWIVLAGAKILRDSRRPEPEASDEAA